MRGSNFLPICIPIYIPSFMKIGSVVSEELRRQGPCSRKTHLLTNRKPLRCPRFRQSVLLWGAPKLPLILTRKIVRFYRSWKSGSEKTLWSTRPQGFENSTLIIPPENEVLGGVILVLPCPSVCLSVCPPSVDMILSTHVLRNRFMDFS